MVYYIVLKNTSKNIWKVVLFEFFFKNCPLLSAGMGINLVKILWKIAHNKSPREHKFCFKSSFLKNGRLTDFLIGNKLKLWINWMYSKIVQFFTLCKLSRDQYFCNNRKNYVLFLFKKYKLNLLLGFFSIFYQESF